MPTPKQDPRTPVTLLTGFLGSGKTTLLNRALRDPAMTRTAVIINEFGEIGIDHALTTASDDTIMVLENGCLCCTVFGDLINLLRPKEPVNVREEPGQPAVIQGAQHLLHNLTWLPQSPIRDVSRASRLECTAATERPFRNGTLPDAFLSLRPAAVSAPF